MKIAIPINGCCVAPTFDFAGQLLLVSYKNGILSEQNKIDFTEKFPPLRAAGLKKLKVNTLLCGAISNLLATMVWHQGINIVSGVSGDAETVLNNFLRRGNPVPPHTLPGLTKKTWKGNCRRYRRGCRGDR